MASDMIKLGGLWTNKDKDGNTFLTGKLNPGVRILIFKNKYREAENHPTHIMYLSQVEQQPSDENKQPEEEDEFFGDTEPTPRPMAPRSAAPAPRTPAPAPAPARAAAPAPTRPAAQRRPSPPPADDDLDDPFAE
ncbi:hypothetical protein [Armatimonas rosea]|uniref:Uncharacterized protein n=1 Tax=Armatimonas rosea TaxID=685828 RepID=A0A7W9W825_ARMRO|nr:hypothetical protein [Armatimonas rosea]MBB6052308.1 hypothetical protein [Armatimonas rosea]